MKREKELCYRCDKKYSIGHRCQLQELQVVICQEEESATDLNTEGEEGSKGLGGGDQATVELSINSVVGLTSSKALKLRGEIKEEGVIVMIDLGATHNFISVELVRRWGLDVHKVASYGVILGTGLIVKGEGVYTGVELKLQGFMVIKDFLPLELGSLDVILGLQWLETLGVTYTN